MGEFDEFDTPQVSAGGGAFSEFNAPHEGAAAPEPRSFLARAKDKVGESFTNLGHTVASAARGAVDLVSPISKEGGLQVPFGHLADPAYRHQLERGISDTVTGGLAEKAANAVSPEFAASAGNDAIAAPDARALGQVGGAVLPSPFTKLAELGGAIPGTGPLASAARGVAGYEASAVPQAAISAPTGHRLEAALDAATDPASLVTAGSVPAVTSFLKRKLDVAAAKGPEIQEAARQRAVKDLGKDITSADGVKSRVTDQKRIAEVNDRLYDLADENPELRQAFSEPAEQALPKVQEFKAKLAQPLDRLYDAIDEHTGGGLDPKQVVGDLRGMAKEARRTVAGLADSERFSKLADQFEQVYITEREPSAAPAPPPEITKALQTGEKPNRYTEAEWQQIEDEWNGKHAPEGSHETVGDKTNAGGKGAPAEDLDGALEQLRKLRENAKGVAAKGIDEQIAKLEGEQAAAAPKTEVSASPFGATEKIPTRVFRHEVTELLKKSDSVMGGIEGTPRFEALQKLYDAGKQIIDKHIDGSGLPADQIAQLRDINNGYFLLSRAEGAIESRGFKEANKPGFKFPTSVRAAAHGGGIAGLATAAAIGGPHAVVHALPIVAGTALASHALPAAAKSLNWQLAHGAYTRGVQRLIDLARHVPRAEFIGAAARVVGADGARRIYDAAAKPAAVNPASAPPNQDITL